MTVPRLTACGADLSRVREIQGVLERGKRNTFSMQDDIEAVGKMLEAAQQEQNPFAMLVIDPVTSYLTGGRLKKVDLNDAGQLRSVLEPWLGFAQQYELVIVCVTHFAKDENRKMLHRVVGSAAFAQTSRSLCTVADLPESDEEEREPYEKALVQVKVNLPDHPGGSWRFKTEKVQVGTDPRNGRQIDATRPQWLRLDRVLTPERFVSNRRGPAAQNSPAFIRWLQKYFETTPPDRALPASSVMEAAISAGIVGKSWWDEHSGQYLEKRNIGGQWFCRPRDGLI